jgi:hypothetical protein
VGSGDGEGDGEGEGEGEGVALGEASGVGVGVSALEGRPETAKITIAAIPAADEARRHMTNNHRQ